MKFLVAVAVCALVGVCAADSYGKPAYPAAPVAHTYAAHAPHVKCGANLLVGCAPNVAHVPCHPAHGGHHEYHHAPAPAYHHAPAPSYHHAPAPAYHAPAKKEYHHAPAPAYHHAPAAHGGYEAKKEYAAPAYHHEAPKKEYGHHAAPAAHHGGYEAKKEYAKPAAHGYGGGYGKRSSDFEAEMED
ncbi:vitelline membrane protein 15a-3-like [Anopheles marshallii]|uniref:vitelline membrane protein 15a-3-like n=1 Tax=Anopheles marshallii TaxID=1521116 RepID=UPI00237BA8DF|nr:vitelline membrane protein 15a-3-like [Anopheles marshallii]